MIRSPIQKPEPPGIDPDGERLHLDLRSLTRLGMWGGAAAAALLVVAVATRTDAGQRRLASALQAGHVELQSVPAEDERGRSLRDVEVENRKLADQIRSLSQDRDRLSARLTVLERNYEDMTGSTRRLGNSPAAPAETGPGGEYGVDLGGATSVAALQAAWERIRRHHASELDGLRAVIAIRDTRAGPVDLRLVVGPIGNAAAAASLCTSLTATGLSCQPTSFDGQKLALR